MSPSEALARLAALDAAATPGKWQGVQLDLALSHEAIEEYVRSCVAKGGVEFFGVLCELDDGPADVCHTGNGPRSSANAMLTAAARNALPALLAVAEAAQGLLASTDTFLAEQRLRAALAALPAALGETGGGK